ncbi:proteoglycan 3-like [Ambystoma mexicanum]|uniref:proteoglycan 3-like n=1 Tax=Ambystoma mexicanum TaxID=8296 RepID=UPI0037E79C37
MNAVTVSLLLVLFLGAVTSKEASGEDTQDEEYLQANGDPRPEKSNCECPNQEDNVMPNKVAACTNDKEGIPITLPGTRRDSKSIRYILYSSGCTFEQAQLKCQRIGIGGRLVPITSLSVNEEIQRLVHHTNRCISEIWIGLRKRCGRNHYTYTSGQRSTYRNWAYGQPERCGNMCATLNILSGKWRSIDCNQKMPFVCRQ